MAELVHWLTMIAGRARAGDERARGELIALIYVLTLRYVGLVTVAAAPGVSLTLVEHDRRLARAWLAGRLGGRDR